MISHHCQTIISFSAKRQVKARVKVLFYAFGEQSLVVRQVLQVRHEAFVLKLLWLLYY